MGNQAFDASQGISAERERIDQLRQSVGFSFLVDRRYREDLEWLTLSCLVDILKRSGRAFPRYAAKMPPSEPDFSTFLNPTTPFRPVEITEVLRPGYRRDDEYKKVMAGGDPLRVLEPHPAPWSSFKRVLSNKFTKSFPSNTWLLIYHNMWLFDFQPDDCLWHERVLGQLRAWTFDSHETCDITKSRYEQIYVLDSGCTGAIRLHPHWDVIKPKEDDELD